MYKKILFFVACKWVGFWKAVKELLLSWLFRAIAHLYHEQFRSAYFYRFNRLMFGLSLNGLGVLNYENDEISGEKHLAHKLNQLACRQENVVIFDVGANVGGWTGMIRKSIPSAQVFAFEPHPKTYQALIQNLNGDRHITTQNIALGSEAGMLDMFDYSENQGSEHASVYCEVVTDLRGRADAAPICVQVKALDDVMAEQKIDRLYFLKIDVEGHEKAVLTGAQKTLAAGKIDFIQFEFNEMNIFSRVFLRDIELLLPQYKLCRLLPDGVVMLEHLPVVERELFAFQNIVAVRNDLWEAFTRTGKGECACRNY